jgi:hypothetical protein
MNIVIRDFLSLSKYFIAVLALIYSSSSSTPKAQDVGFLKSNRTSTTSGIIGTSRLHNRREGNVKVKKLKFIF